MDTVPILQVVGYKNSGKTTLVCNLVKALSQQGFRVGTIKHDGHDFAMDQPGTDTWQHMQAGASATAISSKHHTAILLQEAMTLQQLLATMSGVDFIVVEGFKHEAFPKLVLIRRDEDLELLTICTHVAAVVSWIPLEADKLTYPIVHISDEAGIRSIVWQQLGILHSYETDD